jgi:hypothetical protein
MVTAKRRFNSLFLKVRRRREMKLKMKIMMTPGENQCVTRQSDSNTVYYSSALSIQYIALPTYQAGKT